MDNWVHLVHLREVSHEVTRVGRAMHISTIVTEPCNLDRDAKYFMEHQKVTAEDQHYTTMYLRVHAASASFTHAWPWTLDT